MLVALTLTPAMGLVLLANAPLKTADPPLMRGLKRLYAMALRPLSRYRWPCWPSRWLR